MMTLEQALAYFGTDHFALGQGIRIEEIGPEGAVCSVRLEQRHQNSQGVAQGGLIFTLADFAFAVASNARARGTITMNASINFLAPGTGPVLYGRATLLHGGKKTAVYQVDITNQDGSPVALFTGTGYTKSHYVDRSK